MSKNKQAKRKTSKKLPIVRGRQCGECKACCTVMEVFEMDKPMWTACKHECSSGCAVYGDHPTSCKEWSCFWMADAVGVMMKAEDRPDKIGVFVDVCYPSGSELLFVVRETWVGGSNTSQAKSLIKRLARVSVTAVFCWGKTLPRLTGPEKAMKELLKDGKLVLHTPDGPQVLWESGKENQGAA